MTDTRVNRSGLRHVLALLTLSLLALAAAQTDLEVSSPADRTVVYEPLGEVTLVFDAPVDAGSGRFELVPLQVDAGPTDYTTGGSAWQALDELAMAVYEDMAAGGTAPQGTVGDAGDAGAEGSDEGAAGDEDGAEGEAAGGADAAEMDTPPPALELTTGGEATEVVLSVTGDLQPGDYMVFYEVLSSDSQSISGYIVFSYQPRF